jgi:hypothetical protein
VDARQWLSQVRAELVRRRLPPLYVERLVSELSDHLTDLMEDRMSTDAKDLHGVFQRLGTPGHVAASAAGEYRKARFSRRHPLLMFVVLPLVALPLLWVASVVSIILTVKLLGIETGKVSTDQSVWQWANAAVPYLVVGLMVIPVALAATYFCYLARRAGVSWKWSLAACGLLAVLGGAAMTQFALPTEHSQGSLSFGFGVSAHPSASQMLQFLLPLAIGGWAAWRQFGRHGHSQMT